MSKIITYNFNEHFIDKLAEFIKQNYTDKSTDLNRIAVVFGGKRPALFLKRALGRKINQSFVPPRFFSIDEFMQHIVKKDRHVVSIPDLEAAFSIFTLAKSKVPQIMKSREKFSEFLPWAREIISFIDQLDLEDITYERLTNIEKNAEIGYEVPEEINQLLEHIVLLRRLFHEKMRKDKKYSRGLLYLSAAGCCADIDLKEFDQVLFCNFFDLHKTEKQVIKHFYDQDRAILFFQKDARTWSQFDELSGYFGQEITLREQKSKNPDINLYAGFDNHSQIGIVREVLKQTKDKDKTVIVLPQAENIIPLLSEISSCVQEYNVSMGYPVRCSTLYSLFDSIHRAQKTKKTDEYYTRDYLGVIMHPLLKNLNLREDGVITRILVHKIEEMLSNKEESDISGSLFIKLDDVEALKILHEKVCEQLQPLGFSITDKDLKDILKQLHSYAFGIWEDCNTLGDFAQSLEEFLSGLVEKSMVSEYPLNIKVIKKLYALSGEFRNRAISREKFSPGEIFRVFDDFFKSEKIAFSGMPLKGLQILGLFETRSLTFDNVIIMDVNESVLPRLSANEPLVPRAVMVSLGLDRLEEEEGIQRYQFMRLIGAAKNVHLVYNDNPDKQKSRFIEEIIWQQEKETKSMNTVCVPRAVFNAAVLTKKGSIPKDKNIPKLLKNFVFSASSINTYLNCPMQFYYKYVLGLSEKEDMLDELESREVGTFVHELLEDCFKQFAKKTPQIDLAFRRKFFNEFDKRFSKSFQRRMKSDAFMIEHILRYRLERFLDNEAERLVDSVEGLEQDIIKEINLGKRKVSFKCRIDRIDRLGNDNIVVIDYKTGSSDITPRGIKSLQKAAEIPERGVIKRVVQSFQLPLYLYCVQEQYKSQSVSAALYNLRTLSFDYFPKPKEYEQKEESLKLCMDLLGFIIEEIYDMNIPFEADESDDTCRYCPFFGLCR
ncbi:MAG: hypothetical protein GY853_04775 [PVC group bacterium]|nr:hypothetical protein [PVC group bacterium]